MVTTPSASPIDISRRNARRQHKTDSQGQHADAIADSMERELEMRMQQQPRRIGEGRDGGETQENQGRKPGECAHV
jgi:hypothetical protein